MNTINVENCKTLLIGRRGENEVTTVLFDFTEWASEFGSGVVDLYVKRFVDESAYPVVLTIDGTVASWLVTETDTNVAGYGKAEYVYRVDGKIAKSAVFPFFVAEDIGQPASEPPDPYESWLEQLTALGAETEAHAQAAEQSAEDAAQSATSAEGYAGQAETAAGLAQAAQTASEAARDAAQTAQASAESSATAASGSAASAASSATAAAGSASDASSSASAAGASATAASASATTASNAATAAQTAQSAAEDAAEDAQQAAQQAHVEYEQLSGEVDDLSDEVSQQKSAIDGLESAVTSVTSISGYTRYGAVVDYDSTWWGTPSSGNRKHIVVPISQGVSILSITASSQQSVRFMGLKSEPNAVANGEIVGQASDYWPNPILINESVTLNTVIPQDVKYLVINVLYSGKECVSAFSLTTTTSSRLGNVNNKANSLIRISVGAQNVRDFGDGSGDGCPDNLVSEKLPLWKEMVSSWLNQDFLCIDEWYPYFDRSQTIDAYETIFKPFYPYKFELPSNAPTRIVLSKHPGVLSNMALYASVRTNIPIIICNIGGKSVCVACWLQSVADTVAQRKSAYSAAITYLSQFDIAILAGDFNTEVGLEELELFTDAGYTLGNGGYWGEIDTYPASSPSTPNDNIVTKGVIFERFEVGTDYVTSDHRPVRAFLSFTT